MIISLERRIRGLECSIDAIFGFADRNNGVMHDFYLDRAVDAIIKLRNLEDMYGTLTDRNPVRNRVHLADPQTIPKYTPQT